MVALGINELTADWASAKWLLWIGLYLSLGIVVPWAMTRAWAHQHHSPLRPRLRQVFQNGELGLVGLMLAISVIWDLQKSEYTSDTIGFGSSLTADAPLALASVRIELGETPEI